MLLLSCVAFSQTATEKAAEDSASKWLGLVDAGDYAASWDQAAQFFKNAVSKEEWTEKVKAVRAPFGKISSRKLKIRNLQNQSPRCSISQFDGHTVNVRFNVVQLILGMVVVQFEFPQAL